MFDISAQELTVVGLVLAVFSLLGILSAIQAVLTAQEFHLLQGGLFALRLQLQDHVRQIIARRCLDDQKRHDADHQQRRYHDQDAMDDIGKHAADDLLAPVPVGTVWFLSVPL